MNDLGDIRNKWVILKKNIMKPEYQDTKSRMFFVTGGFGSTGFCIGTAVMGTFIDGESARYERFEVARLARDKEIEMYVSK